MPQIGIDLLSPLVARFVERVPLTPAERAEVLRIAQGHACKDSAAAAGIASETVRARRKRIYRKFDVRGAGEIISQLLALSLAMLAGGERLEAPPLAPGGGRRVADGATAP